MGEHVKIARSAVPKASLDPPRPAPAPFVEVPATGGMEGRARVERADRFGHHLKDLGAAGPGGLPGGLRAGMERLSGLDLSGVRVHYSSSKPAQLQALAYAQGSDIHLAPGQEGHLPHEAWHVVQQKRGRVRPTLRLGGVEINDDPALEKEASDMGIRAAAMKVEAAPPARDRDSEPEKGVVQGWFTINGEEYGKDKGIDKPGLKNHLQEAEFKMPQGVDLDKVIARIEAWANAAADKGKPGETWEDLAERAAVVVAKFGTDEYLSDFEPSDDDEQTTLTAPQKFEILQKHGPRKVKKLIGLDKNVGDVMDLSDPHAQKIFAAGRAKDPSADTTMTIGKQKFRIGLGTGHFLQPGGNKEERPENVKEPPDKYEELLPAIMSLGKTDPDAGNIFKVLLGEERGPGAEFSDAEAARLLHYYAQNDVGEIEKKLGDQRIGRTPLTEHLSKMIAITGLSEQSRGFESDPPYDVSLLIKRGFASVAEGEKSLNEMFYSGYQSIFLGGPNQGGADRLRNPLKYPEALEKQMSIFPDNKGQFKGKLNELKSKTQKLFPALTEEKAEQQAKRKADNEIEKAEKLKREIVALKVPEKNDFDALIGFKDIIYKEWESKIKYVRRNLNNDKAQEVLTEALNLLSGKYYEAESRLPSGARKKRKPNKFDD